MIKQRPLGISIVGGLLTVIGGFASLVIFIEMIDSLASFGFGSILISSISSFGGFLLYGLVPILFYSTGIGLLMSRPWARWSLVFVIPPLTFVFGFHMACHVARRESAVYGAMAVELVFSHFGIFANMFFRLALIFIPLLFYVHRPLVSAYFEEEK